MTIRVTAFQALQPLYHENEEQLEALRKEMRLDPKVIPLSKHPIYPDRADYWPSGFFRSTGQVFDKQICTLHEWDAWVSTLCAKFGGGRSLAEIRTEPKPGPFMELLYFDVLGQHYMIGPKTSEKLARDFADNRGQAETVGGTFYQIFAIMQGAFEMASRSGAVRFSGP